MPDDAKYREFRLRLGPQAAARLDAIKDEIEAATHAEAVRELIRAWDARRAPALAPRAPALPAGENEGGTIPLDELEIRRQRGAVAAFIRLDGRDWKRSGPTPLENGCEIAPEVLAEYAPQLQQLRVKLAQIAREEQQFARVGL